MKHNQRLIVLSGILLSLKFSGAWTEVWLDYAFFIGVMVLIGLPHGAVDHLIHIRQKQQEAVTSRSLGRFLLTYMGMIALYGLVWYLLPTLSLVVFIVLSCYHFGQSQLFYFFRKEGPFATLTYLLWGLAVLSYIVCWNSRESLALIGSLLPGFESRPTTLLLLPYLEVFPWALSLFPVVFLVSRAGVLPAKAIGWELGTLLSIGLVSYYCGLLVAFTVYFGLWHSSKSLRAIVRGFQAQQPGYDYRRFYKDALLFSLLSIVGIGLLTALSYYVLTGLHPVMLFFVLISLLTLPHMVILETVYQKREPQLQPQ
jgi:beta-carotene 15,15'-dioxygenase